MKKKVLIIVVTVVILFIVGLRLAGNAEVAKNKAYMPDLNKSVIVQVETLSKSGFSQDLNYTGTFAPNREIDLIPQAQGEVKNVCFAEGKQVSAGQVLLKIDDALLQSQLIAAKASYNNARINYERFQNSASSEGVTKVQLDNSLLQLKSAESQLKQLEIAISKCYYRAPFSGTISQRSVEVGSMAGVGSIGHLTDVSSLKLELDVPESDILSFKTGLPVNVTSDLYPGETFSGLVEFVSNRGDDSHNYQVKIRVKNSGKNALKAGMYGQVTLQQNLGSSTLAIPRTALLGSVKNPQVYTVVGNIAILHSIVTGRNNGTQIEVLDGLKEGDKVIIGGQINLSDSCKVEIAK